MSQDRATQGKISFLTKVKYMPENILGWASGVYRNIIFGLISKHFCKALPTQKSGTPDGACQPWLNSDAQEAFVDVH